MSLCVFGHVSMLYQNSYEPCILFCNLGFLLFYMLYYTKHGLRFHSQLMGSKTCCTVNRLESTPRYLFHSILLTKVLFFSCLENPFQKCNHFLLFFLFVSDFPCRCCCKVFFIFWLLFFFLPIIWLIFSL